MFGFDGVRRIVALFEIETVAASEAEQPLFVTVSIYVVVITGVTVIEEVDCPEFHA
jgi:hypothetical protein